MPDLIFRRSSRCETHNCIEVARSADGVAVRDSQDTTGPTLAYTPAAWRAFLSGLQAGDLQP